MGDSSIQVRVRLDRRETGKKKNLAFFWFTTVPDACKMVELSEGRPKLVFIANEERNITETLRG